MKTKVVAFRVTEEEHNLLTELCDELGNITFAKLFDEAINQKIAEGKKLIARRESRAKAKATRDAKKAAANGLQ